jgi:hypothetical protein
VSVLQREQARKLAFLPSLPWSPGDQLSDQLYSKRARRLGEARGGFDPG